MRQSPLDQEEHVLIAIYPRPASSPTLVNDNDDVDVDPGSGSGGDSGGGHGGDGEGDFDGATAGGDKGNGARAVGGGGVTEARDWRRDRDSRTEREAGR